MALEADLPIRKSCSVVRSGIATPSSGVRKTRGVGEVLGLLSTAARAIVSQQKISAAVAFWTKTLRDPMAMADWIAFILKHYDHHQSQTPNARLLRKPQRNYGVTGRNVRRRVEALIAHYQFASEHFSPRMHRTLLGPVPVAIGRLEARDCAFDLWLGSSMPFGQKQEGELTAWLATADGVSLARMAFSFGRDDAGAPTLLIGGLQGLAAGSDKKIIVKATRALSGLRPKDAVLVGVQAIAEAFGINTVQAVSNASHVLAAEWFMSDSVISRDYDGFWKERGGHKLAGIGFALPVPDYAGRVRATATPRVLDRHRADLARKVDLALTGAA